MGRKFMVVLCCGLLSLHSVAQTHFVVTKSTDHNPPEQGELRWAVDQANNNPGLDYIDFDISNVSVPAIIDLAHSQSIGIREPIIIDGNTQPGYGYSGIEPKVRIRVNSTLGAFRMSCLNNSCDVSGTIIRNITFSDFSNFGAIELSSAKSTIIENCVFYSGSNEGIKLRFDADSNIIRGNYFGTNRAKTLYAPIAIPVVFTYLTNDDPNKRPDDNLIGGGNINDINYFYNASGYAGGFDGTIRVLSGINNRIENNEFHNNAEKGIGLYHYGSNNDKAPPVITEAAINEYNLIVKGNSNPGDYIEIYKTNLEEIDAEYRIGTAITDNSSKWVFSVPKGSLIEGDRLIGTATDTEDNTSEFIPKSFPIENACDSICPSQSNFNVYPFPALINESLQFTSTSQCDGIIDSYSWDFGDPNAGALNVSSEENPTHLYSELGEYIVTLTTILNGCSSVNEQVINVIEGLPCENCIGSFAPIPGEKYVVSGWAKEYSSLGYVDVNSYTKPLIEMEFALSGGGIETVGPFIPKGYIINEWQLIEEEFEVPLNAIAMKLHLKSQSGTVYFDDIRLYPFDGNMNSFVYDPNTLRLMAELDERNYGTFYEYDEEGRLVRIKKETERGVMTIKENRSFNLKSW